MPEKVRQVLPRNPLAIAGLLDEVKKLKGDKPWLQFELELLTAKYPDNAKFKEALGKVTDKAKAVEPPKPEAPKQEQPKAEAAKTEPRRLPKT